MTNSHSLFPKNFLYKNILKAIIDEYIKNGKPTYESSHKKLVKNVPIDEAPNLDI